MSLYVYQNHFLSFLLIFKLFLNNKQKVPSYIEIENAQISIFVVVLCSLQIASFSESKLFKFQK